MRPACAPSTRRRWLAAALLALAAASARLSVLAGDLKRLHYASRHNDDNA